MNTITTPFRNSFILATLALFLAGTGWLHAGTAGIQDNAGFFSAGAKADAQGNITLAQRTLHKDVEVETFATMPDEVKNGLNLQDKAAVSRAYEKWVDQHAEKLGVNGVYIMIVKDPAHLQVAVGTSTQKQAFTLANRDVLVKGMIEKMHAKDYDGALRHGVAFVVTTMKKNAPGTVHNAAAPATAAATNTWNPPGTHSNVTQSSGGFPWGWIIALVIIFVVIRLAAKLLHALFSGGSSGQYPGGMGTPMGGGGYNNGGGGGGFLRSMMGGVLGAAAGSWMYDNFFGSHGSSSYGASQDRFDNGGQQGGGYTDQDTSFTSSGGDFGDSGSSSGGGFDSGSSGGDSGGGGGGDF